MHTGTHLRIDATKILTRRELAQVLGDLTSKAPRSANTSMNLILVRLACCCGLRVSEIAGLNVASLYALRLWLRTIRKTFVFRRLPSAATTGAPVPKSTCPSSPGPHSIRRNGKERIRPSRWMNRRTLS